MIRHLSKWCLLSSFVACASLAQESEPSTHAAKWVFEEAAALSKRDAGTLWGMELDGPMLLVEPESRRVVANRSTEALVHSGDLYVGVLPDSVGIANTSMNWAGREWTMLMWPLPEDDYDRRSLIAHELWHRIQDEL
ncbi:MAG: hypothetical protein HKN37_11390, partial [Rhodothermales bacterium]|nr:hypothetical protein [Rhodothermales bacterium]